MTPGVAWVAAGLAMMALEMLLPGAFLLWLGLAALGTGLVGLWAVLSFGVEVGLFAVLAAMSIGLAVLLRRRSVPSGVNAPGSGLVGRSATALVFHGREGRVRLGDSDWPARLAGGTATPSARLRVVGVDGMVLMVRPDEVTQP